MNETYLYRKHLRAPLTYLMVYEGTIFLMVALVVLGTFFINNDEMDTMLFMIVCMVLIITFIIITIELIILYFVMFQRFKSIRVTLTEDTIDYTNAKSHQVIPYVNIMSLQFPSIKYTGGWLKIKHRDGTIRLTVTLENIGDLISKLKEKLTELNMGQVYDEKKLFSFYKTAVFSDESWDRIYRNYKSYIVINIVSIIINTIILRLLHISGIHFYLLYGSFVAPVIGLLLSEILIGLKVKKRVDRDNLILLPRDLNYERKVYTILVTISTCIYPVTLIILGLI